MDDGMESPTVVPNKSCVRLGRVNARLRRRRSISRTPHTPVSTIVVRATRRVASTTNTRAIHCVRAPTGNRTERSMAFNILSNECQTREHEGKDKSSLPVGIERASTSLPKIGPLAGDSKWSTR